MLTRLQGAWKNSGMTGFDEILFLFKMVYDTMSAREKQTANVYHKMKFYGMIETRVKVVACGNEK